MSDHWKPAPTRADDDGMCVCVCKRLELFFFLNGSMKQRTVLCCQCVCVCVIKRLSVGCMCEVCVLLSHQLIHPSIQPIIQKNVTNTYIIMRRIMAHH